jgi:Ca2+-binding RTX toxin-like protein
VDNQGAQVTLYHKVNGRYVAYRQGFNGVRRIEFRAYNGNNEFHNNTSLPSKAIGGDHADKFNGGRGKDRFFGNGGDDVLYGRSGSDRLYGGAGRDLLVAGNGAGGEAHTVNVLKGGKQDDTLVGGGGLDKMYGGRGNDELWDLFGNGYLNGGSGNDELRGTDVTYMEMHGRSGKDRLWHRTSISGWIPVNGDDYLYRAPTRRLSENALPRDTIDQALTETVWSKNWNEREIEETARVLASGIMEISSTYRSDATD